MLLFAPDNPEMAEAIKKAGASVTNKHGSVVRQGYDKLNICHGYYNVTQGNDMKR